MTSNAVDELTDYGPAFDEYCAYCDTRLTREDWHPVDTCTTEDGDVTLFSYCDDECRTKWASRR